MNSIISSFSSPPAKAGEDFSFRESAFDFFFCSLPSENTREAYGRVISRLASFLGDAGVGLEVASPVHLGAYREYLGKEGYSVATIKLHVTAIRSFYSHLSSSGLISVNPAANLKAPRLVRDVGATPIFSSVKEVEQFLSIFDETTMLGLRNKAMLSVLFFSMIRSSALCGMNFDDVKHHSSHISITVREKRGRVREIPLNSYAAGLLLRYISRSGISSGPLFLTGSKGSEVLKDKRISRSDLHYLIKRYLKKAKIDISLSAHSFRASGCTYYLESAGATLEHAQRLLGHSSSATTALYDRRKKIVPVLEVERLTFA